MADVLTLAGQWDSEPAAPGIGSSDPSIPAPLSETVTLARKFYADITLDADGPISVPIGGTNPIRNAHVIIARTLGGKVKMRVTSADGATQAWPVDPLAIHYSLSVPITAIDLTRVPGILTTVKLFLGDQGP